MSSRPAQSAVLLIVFNRPETTARVFNSIRTARPSRLYVAADGPRQHRNAEADACNQVREIATDVDWQCEVSTLFQAENLGCQRAVSAAINWFFSYEEEGIILEDDCLPTQSFFRFCDAQLERFRGDSRIFLVSGYNLQNEWKPATHDYFFSNYGGIWGWASWRRAWQHNDLSMKLLPEFARRDMFRHLLGEAQGSIRHRQLLRAQNDPNISAWDYQWGFARHVNSGMACVPSVSLVENIGFGDGATHTSGEQPGPKVVGHEIRFPLRENSFVVVDRDYDDLFFPEEPLRLKLRRMFKRLNKLK